MKASAIGFKILAAIIWVGVVFVQLRNFYTSVPPDNGDMLGSEAPAYYHWMYFEIFLLAVVAFLAIAPNRWLVFSRRAFGVSLLIALFPFCVAVAYDWMSHPSVSVRDFFQPAALASAAITFGPLPVSLALSFWRQQRGEKVTYA